MRASIKFIEIAVLFADRTAAVHTAARASHNLYEVVIALAFANVFKDLFDMCQTVHHGDFYLTLFAEINRSFFDPLPAAGRFVDNMAELFARDHVIHRTHSP